MIILLTGKAATGKSTVASYLQSKYGFQQDQLAAPLKRCVADIFQIPAEIINPETEENRQKRETELEEWPGWSARKLLQFVGTELFRTQVRDDIWVRSLWLRIHNLGGDWAVGDCRFPNEQSFFTDRLKFGEVVTIKVVRTGYDGSVGLKGHASEAHDLPADFVVYNDGSYDELYQKIDDIMVTFKKS